MTQNSFPGSPLPARGLPRRAFAQRAPRPKFRPVDTLWLTSLAILSLAATVLRFGVDAIGDIGAFAAAATVAGLYFIGWRVRDRATGVIAGVLLALTLTYSGSLIGHPATAVFTLLSIAAFAAMAGGQLIAAALLAAVATVLRPDGLLLGAALVCMPPPGEDSRLRWRPISLFLITTALGALLAYSLHYAPPALRIGVTPYLIGQAMLGGNAILAWFLWPFLAEMGEPMRRQRWLPFIVWTVLYLAAESLFYFVQAGQSWPPLAPIFALFVAGGMARLIPVIAGEFANPTMRYALATLAVVSLIGVRVTLDWPHAHISPAAASIDSDTAITAKPAPKSHPITAAPKPHAIVPVPVPIPIPHPVAAVPAPHPATPAPTAPQTTPKPVVAATVAVPPAKPGAVPHHVVKVPPSAVVPQPGAPRISDSEGENNTVRTYIWKNGRLIKRSPWAIAWDRKQQALAKQREAATHNTPAPAAKPTPTPQPAAAKPVAPAPKPTIAAKPATPAPKAVVAPKPAVKRYIAKKPTWKPRARHRSIWAIRWEQAHPKGR